MHFGNIFEALGTRLGPLSAMGLVPLICYWIWAWSALILSMGFFNQSPPPLDAFFEDVVFTINGALLLGIGSLIGAAFVALVFSLSAVSVPLLYDRPIDVITAIHTSLLAVKENRRVMFGWAALILLVTVAGICTFFVGLVVAIPLLAYATWHCYRDLIEPAHETTISVDPAARKRRPELRLASHRLSRLRAHRLYSPAIGAAAKSPLIRLSN